MGTVEFKKSLLNIYYCEQSGEAFYATLLAETDDDNEDLILPALLQLKTEGKAGVRPFIIKYGLLAHDNPKSISGGVETANKLANGNWRSKFEAMVAIIKQQGLPKYEGPMEKVNIEEDLEATKLAQFVDAHERVILQVCEIVNGILNPASPLDDFLRFPISSGPRLLNEESQ